MNRNQSVRFALASAIFAATLCVLPTFAAAQTEKTLHNFSATGNGSYYPYSTLVRDAAGNLYGTTSQGGIGACTNGGGSNWLRHRFRINAQGRRRLVREGLA